MISGGTSAAPSYSLLLLSVGSIKSGSVTQGVRMALIFTSIVPGFQARLANIEKLGILASRFYLDHNNWHAPISPQSKFKRRNLP